MDEVVYEILAALRIGSVPAAGLSNIFVGRARELTELEEQMDFVAQGKSAVKCICGDFGSGKSFFCSLVRERAFSKQFAATTVVVSPDSPLAKFDVVVGKAFESLSLPDRRNIGALADLLERWLLSLLKRTAALEGVSLSDQRSMTRVHKLALDTIEEHLSTLRGIDASFVNAVKAYMLARIDRDGARARTMHSDG